VRPVRVGATAGATALQYAAQRGHFSIIHELLLAGADPNARRRNGDAPMHAAVSSGNADVVDLLRQHGGATFTLRGSAAGDDRAHSWPSQGT